MQDGTIPGNKRQQAAHHSEPGLTEKIFCPYCGGPSNRREWEGMNRRYCQTCDLPLYDNPIPAVCALVTDRQGRILLVQRKVEPKKGEWCLPGGFMELGETPEAAALRELTEETGLLGEIVGLIGLRATPNRLYHTVLVVGYRVKALSDNLHPGDDALAVRWFDGAALPPIAFGSHQEFIKEAPGV